MRSACSVDHVWPAGVIVSFIAIGLQQAVKLPEKLFRSISPSSHLKVKDHDTAWPTVLPQVGLVMLSPALLHLHPHRSFIRLKVAFTQQLSPHGSGHRDQQL